MLSKIRIDGVWHDVADGKWETLLGDKIRENAELQSRLAAEDKVIAEMREALESILGEEMAGESNPCCNNHSLVSLQSITWGTVRKVRAVLAKYPAKEVE